MTISKSTAENRDRANTVSDVAEIFGIGKRTVWRLIESGDLKAVRLGARCIRIF